jgi:hypothetical protein
VKIVFLDFDGVLNHRAWLREHWLRECPGEVIVSGKLALDPAAIQRVNRILRKTGARVVVSSAWRLLHSLDELRELLALRGFHGQVIDATPYIDEEPRGLEIRAWLDAHPEVTAFVALDDATDMDPVRERWVQTTFEHGLQDEHVERAVALLAGRCSDG